MIRQIFLFLLLFPALMFAQSNSVFNVRDFGAAGDGVTLDTKAIQTAIDKCSEHGGTVLIPPGKYLSGSLLLKSNIELYLQNGSLLLGSTNISDYQSHTPQVKSYNDEFLKYSLFYAESVQNISIRGDGCIDGQGSEFKVTTKVKPDRYKNRPFIIRFVDCKNVRIEGITMQNSAMWMQQYLACKNLWIRGIKVYNHANQNNDMMDIDGCKNVVISDCIGDTDDDGITLKSTLPNITENVTITNCIVSSHCNAIKLGTESTGGFRNIAISNIVIKPSDSKTKIYGFPSGICGINLSTVDGGNLEGVTISNIRIDGPQVPIYLRLGNRGRKYTKDAHEPGIGTYQDVMISDITATNIGSVGCSITGIPGHPIENVSLSNINIKFKGGGTEEEAEEIPEELEDHYPESTMWGNLPAYGFFVRHVNGLKMNRIKLSFEHKDKRPAIILNDVDDAVIDDLDAMLNNESSGMINLSQSKDIYVRDSKAEGFAAFFISVNDAASKNVFLIGNDLRNIKNSVHQQTEGQVSLISNINP